MTSTTRVFILCNPHNPVGRVYDREELLRLADFCERHDLILISDEIHCDLILDIDCQHIMSATLDPGLAARTVTLMAPSKTYNLPGLACAYAIIESPQLRRRFSQTLRGIITEINCFGYAGCQAAYQHGEAWRQALLSYLRGNYAYLQKFLAERLPEIRFRPMQATYLAWRCECLGIDKPAHFLPGLAIRWDPLWCATTPATQLWMPAGTLSDGARKDGTRAAPEELIPTDGRRSYR